MSNQESVHKLPAGYVQLAGSDRSTPSRAKLIGEANAAERFSVTVVLRRRADGPPMPGQEYFVQTPPRKRVRLSREEFTQKYGAHPEEMKAVEEFARQYELTVVGAHAGRRQVVLEGTAAQFGKAFSVSFKKYETIPAPSRSKRPVKKRIFRGREGFIHVPTKLAEYIVGVFGLDNRPIGSRANQPGDPPISNTISVAQAASLYNFPAPGAAIANQTIGIVSASGGQVGFVQSDIDQAFSNAGLSTIPVHCVPPTGNPSAQLVTTAAAAVGAATLTFSSIGNVTTGEVAQYNSGGGTYYLEVISTTPTTLTFKAYDYTTQSFDLPGFQTAIPAGTSVYFNLDGETTQDLAITGLAAQSANLACYFIDDTQAGWVGMMGRVLHPDAGDFPAGVNPPSVLSSSYYMSGGDDPDGLNYYGVTTAAMNAITQAFEDATILVNGPTILICTGDFGSGAGVGYEIGTSPAQGDGLAHVIYPASDPWVLAVGGTALGQYIPTGSSTPEWVEFAWNAPFTTATYPWGTSGGGISDFFPVPSYQSGIALPNNINAGIASPTPNTVTPPTPFSATGRGIPDISANADYDTGFSGIALGGILGGQIGNGTSASTPLWAGLIALINSNAGFNLGFANPTLYSLPSTAYNPLNPLWRDPAYPQLATCPLDNSNSTVPGYPTHAGWDAVTGLGSPNGMAILTGVTGIESVYILGGYQSPDIILTDLTTHMPVPLGGEPGGRWDTLLAPSTPYGFSANVHNDSSTDATGVVVSFWAIPGGVGTSGSMVGTPQTVTVPAHSTVTVNASANFVSAGPNDHMCAVVSLYSPSTGCAVNATTALEIPDPGNSMTHQCSAWRNTDSSSATPGGKYGFKLGLGKLEVKFEAPLVLNINTIHVPAEALRTPLVQKIANTLRTVGAVSNQPLYLLPEVLRKLAPTSIEHVVNNVNGLDIKLAHPGVWKIVPTHLEAPSFEVAGEVPKTAKVGDVILVHVAVQYPSQKGRAARTVEFLEFVHITNKRG